MWMLFFLMRIMMGYVDLYVVRGGNQFADHDPRLSDRLYMNNGHGHFSEAVEAIPWILTNKSCVSVADVDHDGDNDLFVGGLADATNLVTRNLLIFF
jgi:hypothetical protein